MSRAERCIVLAAALASACAGLGSDPPPGGLVRSTERAGAKPSSKASVEVAPGESACVLAGRIGVDPDALLVANRVEGPPELPLQAGKLWVPGNAGLRHRVQRGETLQALSGWYGHPVGALASRNGIDDPDLVRAGTWLTIPPGAKTGCPPAMASVASRPAVANGHPARRAPQASSVVASPSLPRRGPPLSEDDLVPVDGLLAEARDRYDAADFEAVLDLAEAAGRAHASGADAPASVERRARALWLAGLAHAALGRRDEAIASLREALKLRPSLRDDPSLSPRILGLLEAEAGRHAQP